MNWAKFFEAIINLVGQIFEKKKEAPKAERPSPGDIVPLSSIRHINSNVVIDLAHLNIPLKTPPKVWIPSIPDSGSMDQTFDTEHNNILIAGSDREDHQVLIDRLIVGDIAVYSFDGVNSVIHRIVRKGIDEEGRYFIFQGDNLVTNPKPDPGKVRDSQILWVSIGTIY